MQKPPYAAKAGRFKPYRPIDCHKSTEYGRFWRRTSHYARINRRGIAHRQTVTDPSDTWVVERREDGATCQATQIPHAFMVNPLKGRGTGHPNDWLVKLPDGSLEALDSEDFLEDFEVIRGPERSSEVPAGVE